MHKSLRHEASSGFSVSCYTAIRRSIESEMVTCPVINITVPFPTVLPDSSHSWELLHGSNWHPIPMSHTWAMGDMSGNLAGHWKGGYSKEAVLRDASRVKLGLNSVEKFHERTCHECIRILKVHSRILGMK